MRRSSIYNVHRLCARHHATTTSTSASSSCCHHNNTLLLLIFVLLSLLSVHSTQKTDDTEYQAYHDDRDDDDDDNNNNNNNEDDLSLLLSSHEDHPDPNEEDHEGMIYVGRVDAITGRRMSADHDNTVRYVFGTAFDDSHLALELEDLQHLESSNHSDMPGQVRAHQKTREQVLQERQTQNRTLTGPVPFGHVETHPLDGGVTPTRPVAVEPFWLDATPVTNKEFAKFVKATFYETEAEKYGWSFVLSSFVIAKTENTSTSSTTTATLERDPDAPDWVAIPGAYWRRPEGERSSYKYREHHPVVHVSHRDAAAYCAWRNHCRLPGEREYEAASRAGHWSNEIVTSPNGTSTIGSVAHAIHNRTVYAWGDQDDWTVAAQYANLWNQGSFPNDNNAADGWRGTSPVQHFPPNSAGFYDLTGNVWEWMRGGRGHKRRIVRGASYVDSLDGSFNHAATLGARAVIHGTTTTGNVGFRCAKAIRKRVEHHWAWHDDKEVDGNRAGHLTVEDAQGRRRDIPRTVRSGAVSEEGHSSSADDDVVAVKRKKKKVVKKREVLSTEL